MLNNQPVDQMSLVQENKSLQTSRSTRHNVVWTQGQLKTQSEHIDQTIRQSRANQLEAPHIEAIFLDRNHRSEIATAGTPSKFNSNQMSKQDRVADEEEGDDAEADSRRKSSSPSIVIPIGQFMAEAEENSVAPSSGNRFKPRDLNKDYELDELVNFTCHSVLQGDELGDTTTNKRHTSLYSIHVQWFINNLPISSSFVNTFYGEQFYSKGSSSDSNSTRGIGLEETTSKETSDWLLIEFTSSLLQLNELNLKCKTILEQPLIEYESSQIISLASSPFIQASDEHRHHKLGKPNQIRPSMYNVREPQQRGSASGGRYQLSAGSNNYDYNNQPNTGQQQRHRSNLVRMRQSQAKSYGNGSLQATHLNPSILVFVLVSLIWCHLLNMPIVSGLSI